MKNRNLIAVILLTFITLGIYGIYWQLSTASEMKKKGADIAHWIFYFIPLINLFWLWKYSDGVEKVTEGKFSAPLVFLLFLLTGIGGMIVSQVGFNKQAGTTEPANASPNQFSVSGQARTDIPAASTTVGASAVGAGAGLAAAGTAPQAPTTPDPAQVGLSEPPEPQTPTSPPEPTPPPETPEPAPEEPPTPPEEPSPQSPDIALGSDPSNEPYNQGENSQDTSAGNDQNPGGDQNNQNQQPDSSPSSNNNDPTNIVGPTLG